MDLLELSRKIRSLRLSQGLTVGQLAEKSSFSKGFISQVENFRVTPSLNALKRLSDALGVPLSQLFQEESKPPPYTCGHLDKGEEIFRDDNLKYGIRYFALAFPQIGRNMDPFLVEYTPSNEERDFMMHDTEEFYVLLEGELDFYIMDEKNFTRMRKDDTLYMKANLPHKVRLAPGCQYAKALIIYGSPELK